MTTRGALIVALLVALVYSSPHWMQADEPAPAPSPLLESAKGLQAASDASSAAKAAALQRVLRDAERHRETLSPEQQAMIEDLRSARGAPRRERALENLLATLDERKKETLSFYGWAAGVWASFRDAYRDVQPRAQTGLWTLAILLVAVGITAAVRSRMALARLCATVGFRISRGWLVVLSFLAIAIAIATRTNPWPAFPSELVLPPLLVLVGCAVALRLVDFNYPVWNSLIRGCGAPLISMGFVVTYLKLV